MHVFEIQTMNDGMACCDKKFTSAHMGALPNTLSDKVQIKCL